MLIKVCADFVFTSSLEINSRKQTTKLVHSFLCLTFHTNYKSYSKLLKIGLDLKAGVSCMTFHYVRSRYVLDLNGNNR